MCRFIAYLGKPITADELLLKPVNSLVHQSYSAGEMSEILNGDGFGLGWYGLLYACTKTCCGLTPANRSSSA